MKKYGIEKTIWYRGGACGEDSDCKHLILKDFNSLQEAQAYSKSEEFLAEKSSEEWEGTNCYGEFFSSKDYAITEYDNDYDVSFIGAHSKRIESI